MDVHVDVPVFVVASLVSVPVIPPCSSSVDATVHVNCECLMDDDFGCCCCCCCALIFVCVLS